jgi:von Willebrand factor type A domain
VCVFSEPVSRNRLRAVFVAFAMAGISVSFGCGSITVTKVAASAHRPANVAIYLDVHDKNGKAVSGLKQENFNVYEDGALLDPRKLKRALIEPPTVGVRYTLVLVDLSGGLADSKDTPAMAATIGRFVERLSGKQMVAVSVFDGNDAVEPVLDFDAGAEEIPGMVSALRKFKPRSRNTNWNGGIYQGLYALEKKLNAAVDEHKSASLIVLTDRGRDLSHAVGASTMMQKVRDSDADIYAVGVGPGIDKTELGGVGRSGAFLSKDPRDYDKGFEQILLSLTGDSEGRYIVSYCSPKRKGNHKVEVEVVAASGKARVSYDFNAKGFKPGCSPRRPPKFQNDDQGDKNGPEDADLVEDGSKPDVQKPDGQGAGAKGE